MDRVKNTIHLQSYPAMNQNTFVSIQEDGSTCLKHMVGYASPKLTPKHTRSVKQSKRRTKNQEAPQFEFPPPPSFPPPEHYDLSDEYSADLIDNNVPNCKGHYSLNDYLVRFRTGRDDKPPEGFWNSPVEAPWSYFLSDVRKNSGGDKINGNWLYEHENVEKVTNLDEQNEFWDSQAPQEGWIFKNVESSTPYMERKSKVKKKSKKNKMKDETDHISEEIMLINKLKEDLHADEKSSQDLQGFRNEIWVSSASNDEERTLNFEKNQDTSSIQIKNNHISNVLITHGNDEILDNFIENKPIHKGIVNSVSEENCEVHLFDDYTTYPCNEMCPDSACEKCDSSEQSKKNTKENKVTVVSANTNRQDPVLSSTACKDVNEFKRDPLKVDLRLTGDSPDEYSYAYYEPGPINRLISNQEPKKREKDRNSRYTYTTRYGTEENIYEEITEVSCNLRNRFFEGQKRYDRQPRHFHHGSLDSGKKYEGCYVGGSKKSQSQMSLNQSIVEEEVREVQSTHRRVLGQLNLTMEEMLMPNVTKEKDGIKGELDFKKEDFTDDNPTNQVTDLDSGFSGSSGTSVSFYGVSNYGRSAASFRRPDLPRSSLSSSSKVYPHIPFKIKNHSDMIDYRSRGCCGEHCCSVKAQYQCSGGRMPGNIFIVFFFFSNKKQFFLLKIVY